MKTMCLVLNDREALPETALEHLSAILTVAWYQRPDSDFDLADALIRHPETEILVTTYMQLNAQTLEKLPKLRAIIATTTAVEYIDAAYCQAHGIKVFSNPRYTGGSVAEFAIAMLFATARHIIEITRTHPLGDAPGLEPQGIELGGKRLGIVGLGDIGTRVARMARAIGMEVVHFTRKPHACADSTGVDLRTLITSSDAIILTLPLNAESRGLIGAPEIESMKPGAMLVSISPDAIIDIDALANALARRALYAALDLHAPQPLLRSAPNVLLSHRRAWYTRDCFDRRIASWTRILEDYLKGQTANVVP